MKKFLICMGVITAIWINGAVGRTYISRKTGLLNVALYPEKLGVPIGKFQRMVKECEFDWIDFEQFLKVPWRQDFRLTLFLRPKEQHPYAAAYLIHAPERGWSLEVEDWYKKQ